MLAVLKLSFSRLRKSKLQNVFIALLILLSTLLVSTAFIVLANTGNQFEEMHARTNGSHQVLTFEKGLNDPQADHDWWTSQKASTSLHCSDIGRCRESPSMVSNSPTYTYI